MPADGDMPLREDEKLQLQSLGRMLDTAEIPGHVFETYRRAKKMLSRIDCQVTPVMLALIGLFARPDEDVGQLDVNKEGWTGRMFDWEDWGKVPIGTPVVCDWHGIQKGSYRGLATRGRLQVKIKDQTHKIRTWRVKMEEHADGPLHVGA